MLAGFPKCWFQYRQSQAQQAVLPGRELYHYPAGIGPASPGISCRNKERQKTILACVLDLTSSRPVRAAKADAGRDLLKESVEMQFLGYRGWQQGLADPLHVRRYGAFSRVGLHAGLGERRDREGRFYLHRAGSPAQQYM
jgi:hypothetical protein